MSELNAFIEDPVETPEEAIEPEVTAEVEPEPEAIEPEQDAVPTAAEEHKPGNVPLAALLDEREKRKEYQHSLEQMQKELEALKASQEVKAAPTLESCNYDEAEYQRQVADFNSQSQQQTKEQLKAELLQEIKAEQQQEVIRQKTADFWRAGSEIDPNFQVLVTDESLLVSAPTAEMLFDMDNGPKVLHQIAVSPKLKAEFNRMNEYQQVAEIRSMSDRLKFQAEAKPTPPEIPTSLTNIRAAGGNQPPAIDIPDPLESTFNR